MAKIAIVGQAAAKFMCPGCEEEHTFFYNGRRWPVTGATWNWDGNTELPTISPSLNIYMGQTKDGKELRCHSVVTKGMIFFCGDCTHKLANQAVPLPDIEPYP
jgi:Family of unknown function (DUF6527)